MNAPVYRPKRLAWESVDDGWYTCRLKFTGLLQVWCNSPDKWSFNKSDMTYESLEAAQAAAQAWYDARMLEGLEIVTTESEVRDE